MFSSAGFMLHFRTIFVFLTFKRRSVILLAKQTEAHLMKVFQPSISNPYEHRLISITDFCGLLQKSAIEGASYENKTRMLLESVDKQEE